MPATKQKPQPRHENWTTYFEGSPKKARVIHYIRHICLHGKYKCVNMKYEEIAQRSGVSKRTVIDAIKEAVDLGILLKLSLGFKKRKALTWKGDLTCAKLEKTKIRSDLGLPSLTLIAPKNTLKIAPQIALYNTVHKSRKPKGLLKSLSFQKKERGRGSQTNPKPTLASAEPSVMEIPADCPKDVREIFIADFNRRGLAYREL